MGRVNDVDQTTDELENETNDELDFDSESEETEELFSDMQIPNVPELQHIKNNMQKGWTQKTQELAEKRRAIEAREYELRDKASKLDNLMDEYEKRYGNQTPVDDEDDTYAKYGEQADLAKQQYRDIAKEVAKILLPAIEPITKGFNSANKQAQMDSLQNFVRDLSKQTGMVFPNPIDYQVEINSYLKETGGKASMQEAYQAVIDFSKVKVRKSVEDDKVKKVSASRPGGSGGNIDIPKTRFTPDDVIEARKNNKPLPTWEAIKDAVRNIKGS